MGGLSMELRAQNQIRTLIKNGLLERASEFTCFICGDPAQEFHHFAGYEGFNAYRVIPTCKSCHGKLTNALEERRPYYDPRRGETNRKNFLANHDGHVFKIVPNGKYERRYCRTCATE